MSGRAFTADRAASLAKDVDGHVGLLVSGEVARLLARCGMAELAERYNGVPGFTVKLQYDSALRVRRQTRGPEH